MKGWGKAFETWKSCLNGLCYQYFSILRSSTGSGMTIWTWQYAKVSQLRPCCWKTLLYIPSFYLFGENPADHPTLLFASGIARRKSCKIIYIYIHIYIYSNSEAKRSITTGKTKQNGNHLENIQSQNDCRIVFGPRNNEGGQKKTEKVRQGSWTRKHCFWISAQLDRKVWQRKMEPDRFGSSFRNENLAISDSKNVKGSQNNLDVYDIYIYTYLFCTHTQTHT